MWRRRERQGRSGLSGAARSCYRRSAGAVSPDVNPLMWFLASLALSMPAIDDIARGSAEAMFATLASDALAALVGVAMLADSGIAGGVVTVPRVV